MTTSGDSTPKGRDVAPTGVRLPPPLRDQLVREAAINNRSLSSEIIARLQATVDKATPYAVKNAATVFHTGEHSQHGAPLTDTQRMLLSLFDALPPEKQLALLTVLKR